MALFSKQNKEVFTNPLNLDHPILGQVLGICSALAVTSQLKPAIVMGLAVTVITAFANVIISIIRNTIPNRIRIVVQLVVVAASRVEAKNPALLSNRDGYLLELTGWNQRSQAS